MMAFHVNQCINNEIPLHNINYQMRSALICIQSSNAIRALQIDCTMSFAFILTIKSHISHWTMQSYNRISCKQYNLQFSNTSFICQKVVVFVYCCIIFLFLFMFAIHSCVIGFYNKLVGSIIECLPFQANNNHDDDEKEIDLEIFLSCELEEAFSFVVLWIIHKHICNRMTFIIMYYD